MAQKYFQTHADIYPSLVSFPKKEKIQKGKTQKGKRKRKNNKKERKRVRMF
jgi:hypothetical protein